MAINDVKIVDSAGYSAVPTRTFKVDDLTTTSDTTIYPGEPVKIYGEEDGNYAVHLATGDPEIGTDIMIGIASSQSTATSSAEGTVDVYMPMPGVVYRCAATTPANLDDGVLLDTVCFDLTTLTYTVDENEGSDENVHPLRIVDYNSTNGTVDFIINPKVTILDGLNA